MPSAIFRQHLRITVLLLAFLLVILAPTVIVIIVIVVVVAAVATVPIVAMMMLPAARLAVRFRRLLLFLGRRGPHQGVALPVGFVRLAGPFPLGQILLCGLRLGQVLFGLAVLIEAGALDKVLRDAERLAQFGVLLLLGLGDVVGLADTAMEWGEGRWGTN